MKMLINKNRGWRGLAEAIVLNEDGGTVAKSIFSFSEAMWQDMLKGYMVMQQEDNYIVFEFTDLEPLPHGHQRSVLIKNFSGTVTNMITIPKAVWQARTQDTKYFSLITHFIKNRNNHTQSDWNCVGIRVIPII